MIVIGSSKIDVQKIQDIVYSPRPKGRIGTEMKVYSCRLTVQPYFAWESKPAIYRTRIYAGMQVAELWLDTITNWRKTVCWTISKARQADENSCVTESRATGQLWKDRNRKEKENFSCLFFCISEKRKFKKWLPEIVIFPKVRRNRRNITDLFNIIITIIDHDHHRLQSSWNLKVMWNQDLNLENVK